MLALLGFATMIIITVVLLKKWMSTLLAFTLIPTIAGIIALLVSGSGGSIIDGVNQLGNWYKTGLGMTSSFTLMMIFSLPYFMLMDDTGLFDDIVKAIMKRVKISAPAIFILTVIVACIVELDGSITSVFLITVPLMLPLYDKFKLDKRIMILLIAVSILIMCNTPWNPKILRASSLVPDLAGGSTALFLKIVPIQIFMLVVALGVAIFYGIRSRHNVEGSVQVSKEELLAAFKDTELTRHDRFWVNLLLTAFMFFCLVAFPSIPQYFLFAFGLVLALAINFPDLSQQNKLLKKYASSLFPVCPAVFLSGVVVGVMTGSGMLDAMVNTLISIIPSAVGPYFYLIIAFLSTPLMLLFTNDTWFYTLMPLLAAFSAKYGVAPEAVIAALFMNFGSMISVIAQPQLYIATDLSGVSMDEHIKFSWSRLMLINALVVVFGVVSGVFLH